MLTGRGFKRKRREDKEDQRPGTRRLGKAYQGGLEAVLAVVVAMGLGLWADSIWDTSPIFLILGLVIGFGSFVLGLVRLLHELEQDLPEPERKPSDSEVDE